MAVPRSGSLPSSRRQSFKSHEWISPRKNPQNWWVAKKKHVSPRSTNMADFCSGVSIYLCICHQNFKYISFCSSSKFMGTIEHLPKPPFMWVEGVVSQGAWVSSIENLWVIYFSRKKRGQNKSSFAGWFLSSPWPFGFGVCFLEVTIGVCFLEVP